MQINLPSYLSDEAATSSLIVSSLQLCQAGYAPTPADVAGLVEQVQPLQSGYSWTCLSNTVQTDNDTLLAFVAQYGPANGDAILYAVVIRGTDTQVPDPWSIINQVEDDVDVFATDPVPWGGWGSSGFIASGTFDAYQTITAFPYGYLDPPPQPNSQALQDYVVDLVKNGSSSFKEFPFVLVVGHSLGGCLASVIGPDIAAALSSANEKAFVIPITFAAPTAGNT